MTNRDADLNQLESAFQELVTQGRHVLAVSGTKAEASLYTQFDEILDRAFSLLRFGK